MYRILIVEDTPAESDNLRAQLARYSGEHDEQFAVEVMASAVEFDAKQPSADLIFMDIDMPGMNGMEAAEALRGRDGETLLIFVTNLAQYAVHGYAVDALDFIVKPVTYDDFALRMDRAMRQLRKRVGTTITLPTADGSRVVSVRDIVYVDILHHDLYYHVDGLEAPLRLRGSIKAAGDELGADFVRVSSSCLANMAHVRLIRQGSVVLSSGEELFFSRGCRKEALEALNAYVGRSM